MVNAKWSQLVICGGMYDARMFAVQGVGSWVQVWFHGRRHSRWIMRTANKRAATCWTVCVA